MPSSARSRPTSTCSPTRASREAIAIDTAIPSLAWISGALEERGWTLKLIVSTHGHWDHIGDNAAVAAAHRRRDRRPSRSTRPARPIRSRCSRRRSRSRRPCPRSSWPRAARSGSARSGCASSTRPATRQGSVCLLSADDGLLFSGDTLFAGGWGRIDLPGGSDGGDGRVARPAGRPRGPPPRLPRARARRRRSAASGLAGRRPPRGPAPDLSHRARPGLGLSRRGGTCPRGSPCRAPRPCRAPPDRGAVGLPGRASGAAGARA